MIEDIRSQGREAWLDREMSISADSASDWLTANGFDEVDDNAWYDRADVTDRFIWRQLFEDRAHVRVRVALALSEFLVVSVEGLNFRWASQAMAHYWDILQANAFGNFRTLLGLVALSPAMGAFLNAKGSRRADASGRLPDENFARELMQLFTIGLDELNEDGTVRLDVHGRAIPTFAEDDVAGLARVFTGFDFDYQFVSYRTSALDSNQRIPSPDYTRRPMTADAGRWRNPLAQNYHENGEKHFLGNSLPAGTGAVDSVEAALDILFSHPNAGPFFARRMIQRLVTSNPSAAYIKRVALVFDDNGEGVRGDLKAVFRAILLDEDALDGGGLSNPSFGKLREPMLRFVQWGRTHLIDSKSGLWEVRNTSNPAVSLGQSPLRAPSVFNFFRPSYRPPNSHAANAGLVAPEMQVVDANSVAAYANFMAGAIEGRESATLDLTPDYSAEMDLADDVGALIAQLNLQMTAGQLSEKSLGTIRSAIEQMPLSRSDEQADRQRRVHAAIMLTMAAPEYLVAK